ncbi:MAG: DUF58 domain-containing protein [Betaproteobacteria bacterium HGW-Betaproteobacteria-10]|jgi:uncharacterized protein (DUF58 family)|nr:MAG: DUF58 domain-containing protein [Betaproteobacteria bacterium HGW-Betaproteobacteria-10]
MRIIATLQQKLFRWQSDGTAPLRLGQRRVFIIPTRGGLLFALSLIVMLLGAINYTLALGHALVFLLAGLGMTGMVHTFRNLYGLIITPGRCEAVFAGEIAHFQITLGNDRNSPRLALELEAEAGQMVIAAVNAKESTKINIPVSARQRGWLALPRVRLASRYPLGLFVAWSYLQPAMRCLIYPQPMTFPLPAPSPVTAGVERHGDGGQEDFAGFRERQPADSPRHVAWKASARDIGERPLLIKQFAGGGQIEMQLDWSLTDPALPIEHRLSVLTGWVQAAESAGCSYSLRLPGQEIPAQTGEPHRRQCLEALALFQP